MTIGVVGYTLWGPVKAVLVVGLVGAEANGVEVGNELAGDSVDHEEDGRFVGLDLPGRKKLNVYFLAVVEVLGTILAWLYGEIVLEIVENRFEKPYWIRCEIEGTNLPRKSLRMSLAHRCI